MDSAMSVPAPSPEKVKESVRHLKEWMSKEPHLPTIENDAWLETYLFRNKFSLEKTKHKLENLYTFRTKFPKILKNRDPTAPELLLAKKAVTVAISNKLSKTGEIMYFYKVHDASLLNSTDFIKRLFMILEMLLLEHPKITSSITVVDSDGITYQHVLKMSMVMGTQDEIFQKAYTLRPKAIHFINASNSVHMITDTMKKFVSPKISERMCTHTSTSSTLLEMVDEGMLCSDFGGKGPSLAELDEYTQQLLEKHRKWFQEQDSLCSNESLRMQHGDQVDELKGSFRKLEVD